MLSTKSCYQEQNWHMRVPVCCFENLLLCVEQAEMP